MKIAAYLMVGAVALMGGQLSAGEPVAAGVLKGVAVETQKKILVVYYSRSGNTKKVAEDIARTLNADMEQLIDKKDRSGALGYMVAGKDAALQNLAKIEPVTKDPALYDLVVLGTPVWSWNMAPALRTYIIDHKAALKQIAIFTTAGNTKPDKIAAKMEALADKKASALAGFMESDLKEQNRAVYEGKLHAFIALMK